ncbi:hypothetical protein ONZ45_g17361 [Pleurotus djamor]|nr:hypothetical protein ONZ45_g17361 [Pleurotus djamor]
MADQTPVAPAMSSTFANQYTNMTDSQLRHTISSLQSASNQINYATPTPQAANSSVYIKNLQNWTTTSRPGSATRSTRSRAGRPPNVPQPVPQYQPQPTYQPPQPINVIPAIPTIKSNVPKPPLPTQPQAVTSTYASRLRTGTTLLMQPILSSSSTATTTRTATRRGGVVNYVDPGSGDDLPDAGELESDDSDFVASGGTRTAVRQSRRLGTGMSVFNPHTGVSSTPVAMTPQPAKQSTELDRSYLGMVPPERFIKARPIAPTSHEYPSQWDLDVQAKKSTALIPIRVEFETETHRIRDCFVWNVNDTLTKPETFAKIFCNDLDLPLNPWAETVTNQIRAQLEEHEGVATMEIGMDGAVDMDLDPDGEELPECRVIVGIDVQIANHHLQDHIEWDLLSPLTPEVFSQKLCMELGLSGEAVPLIAHAVHEELVKHKKDAVEWGVIGVADKDHHHHEDPARAGSILGGDRPPRDKSGAGLMKDKTGLGLGWGRSGRDGKGPKHLQSVWRDWADLDDFRTKFEVLTAEEVERREVERERASRPLVVVVINLIPDVLASPHFKRPGLW